MIRVCGGASAESWESEKTSVRTLLPPQRHFLSQSCAFWASWADCFPMVWKRHPHIVAQFITQLKGVTESEHLRCAVLGARSLDGIQGFEILYCTPGVTGKGGNTRHRLEWSRNSETPSCSQPSAMPSPQSGPGARMSLCTTLCNPMTRLDSSTFRVLLCRRLHLLLPLTKHICRCGRRTDIYGHHRAVCAQSGVFVRRGFALESVAARVCREGGARVATNVMVRDMDVALQQPLHRSPC